MSDTEDDERLHASLWSRRITFQELPSLATLSKDIILEQKFLMATFLSNVPAMEKFIKMGVNPNCYTHHQNVMDRIAAIHIGAERGDTSVLKELLKCPNIKLNPLSGHGFTPLHLTCIFNKPEYALLLLQRGADPDLPDRISKSPVHLAIISESYKILFHLIRFKANINVLDIFNRSPLSICLLDTRNIFIAKVLLKQNADVFYLESKRPLHVFFETVLNCDNPGLIDYVTLLLDFGVDVNLTQPIFQRNCLHFIGITGFLPLAVELVKRGARLDVVDSVGRTPYDVAHAHGNYELADFLSKGYTASDVYKTMPMSMGRQDMKLRDLQEMQEGENSNDLSDQSVQQ